MEVKIKILDNKHKHGSLQENLLHSCMKDKMTLSITKLIRK